MVTEMPGVSKLWLIATLSTYLSAAVCAEGMAAEPDFGGTWVVRHHATFVGDRATDSADAKDQKVYQIDHDPASGRVTMRAPDLTPEMLALGYQPRDLRFAGLVEGDAAVGTSGLFGDLSKVLWRRDIDECPPSTGLLFRTERHIEFIAAVPLREACKWSFTAFADRGGAQRVVFTLEPLFIVREVRFLDQPDDGSPSSRITTVTSADQKFQVEVEFELPPPAPVYVELGNQLVVVRSAGAADVFRSDTLTMAGLQGQPNR